MNSVPGTRKVAAMTSITVKATRRRTAVAVGPPAAGNNRLQTPADVMGGQDMDSIAGECKWRCISTIGPSYSGSN